MATHQRMKRRKGPPTSRWRLELECVCWCCAFWGFMCVCHAVSQSERELHLNNIRKRAKNYKRCVCVCVWKLLALHSICSLDFTWSVCENWVFSKTVSQDRCCSVCVCPPPPHPPMAGSAIWSKCEARLYYKHCFLLPRLPFSYVYK